MITDRQEILKHLDALLQSAKIRDYCPNGLQVAGRKNVQHIITGVTASQALIDIAIERGADTILVHHGYFWKGEDERIVGIKKERLKALLTHDINLIAYHLPLDMHPIYGNNAQLADVLGLQVDGLLDESDPSVPGNIGRLPRAMSGKEFRAWLGECLKREPLHIGEDNDTIETIAWCTGGAQGYLQRAIDAGVDAYLTGEINEPAVHLARETGTHFFSAGHHATERYGVKALGEYLADEFGLNVEFVDIDNPV
ncbi:MAG: Nif3-like dinuclear metal center hexameric protein [Thalassolituus sp.]|jgi:dinuclear metal center YbgI/SA1388 family protein|uniref:GTP cyclohydrolase 1 type 2 homolog n=2 Tax=root TaxID=1 RepID=M5E7X8_9GAMM|nr:Nif3-like dinuclear metal center hexameric protein [Thalassolituus oleivorans]PCI48361.1 MAG: Nif3-like dinuclear metal center hexameric protein [Oceanospirillales bacterium]PHQ87106.1 MAG: Nif3-like dinuclear metal center hexameric protein [Thalassobium sp.]AHK14901.1 metal-binding protein [Thalassolituus oleivorans R6-15]APR65943.1 Nif3-like dinuclear metal center hexameric protein [Thalassolituus oleivorans]MBQ0728672.1 Nif3-like dinuclear metal center hexameric protein [Thalassolituus o|tara:strand:- start:1190 stop:1951 length:762 start_codon:yes stop_codon:yes gene_type:complete